jgi:myo-inositol-1(or 4)-monophosphatase
MRDFLAEMARETGALLMTHFGKLTQDQIESKGPRDLVSFVDRSAEDLLRKRILERFPDDAILGEEKASRDGCSGARWILDPLDGTTNYLHGFPFFCISIGYEVDGQMEAGCIYAPCMDELFLAQRGQGATCNGEAIHVSQAQSLGESLVVTGFADARTHDVLRTTRLERILNRSAGVRRLGSAAYDLCNVARGGVDGFFEWSLNAWDVAAGALLIEEAGGIVRDAQGGQDWLEGRTIVAAGPGLHAELLKALDTPLAPDHLGALQDQMRSFAAARAWQPWHTPKNLAMALMVEAAELAEHFQWLTPEEASNLSPEARQEAGEELADVLSYSLSMANSLGLDLAHAFQQKMIKNAEKYPVGAASPRTWGQHVRTVEGEK